MTDTYQNVDESADPGDAAAWQDRVDGWPAVQAYKRRSHELAGTGFVLDVGCGTGGDAVDLGIARTIGADRSVVMVTRAQNRGVRVVRADATALPVPDESFDAVRADRLLQHLDDPGAALAEMCRATKRGGRVVVADPDQETLAIAVPGVSRELCHRLKVLRRDVGLRNGTLASRLPQLFAEAALTDVVVEAFPLVLTDPDDAFGLPSWPRYWNGNGAAQFRDEELAEWDAGIGRGRREGIVYSLSYFVVAGTRR